MTRLLQGYASTVDLALDTVSQQVMNGCVCVLSWLLSSNSSRPTKGTGDSGVLKGTSRAHVKEEASLEESAKYDPDYETVCSLPSCMPEGRRRFARPATPVDPLTLFPARAEELILCSAFPCCSVSASLVTRRTLCADRAHRPVLEQTSGPCAQDPGGADRSGLPPARLRARYVGRWKSAGFCYCTSAGWRPAVAVFWSLADPPPADEKPGSTCPGIAHRRQPKPKPKSTREAPLRFVESTLSVVSSYDTRNPTPESTGARFPCPSLCGSTFSKLVFRETRRPCPPRALPAHVFLRACVWAPGVAGLPLLVPVMAVAAVVGSVGALLAAAVWVFSRGGRAWVQGVVKPVYDKVGREDPEVREGEREEGGNEC